MYSRPFIRSGDKTTSMGTILAPFNGMTVGDDSRHVCYEGNPVYCPACDSLGITKCIPPFRQFTGFNGRQANLNLDICICRCPVPPTLVASQTAYGMSFEAHEIAPLPEPSSSEDFDERVRLVALESQLDGIPIFIDLDNGDYFFGLVADDGLLPRIKTKHSGFYQIYWGGDALEKMEILR